MHPYTTQARVELFLGADRVTALGDRDSSGAIDTGLMADAIERICNRIDGALGGRYSMPCAAITDSTATPGQVADLCDLGVAMLLYQWIAPSSSDAKQFRLDFEGEKGDAGQLGRYRTGVEKVIGLALLTDTADAQRPLTYESVANEWSGRADDDYTDDGVSRNYGT